MGIPCSGSFTGPGHSEGTRDQNGNDMLPENTEQKKQSFSLGLKVPELLSSLTNIKNEQQNYPSLLQQAHISVFYSIQAAVRLNNWDTAACNKHRFLSNESISSSCSQIDVEKENAESPRTGMRIPNCFISEDVKQLSKSKSKISVAGGHKRVDVCD